MPKTTKLQVGTVATFMKGEPPDDWLLCDGGTFHNDDYPELAELLGNKWGPAPEDQTRLPDLRERKPWGITEERTPFYIYAASGSNFSLRWIDDTQ